MTEHLKAKPFLKWAGGKTQLIPQIEKYIPSRFEHGEFQYVEPFVGGGAFIFHVLSNYPNVKKVIINDLNKDLINCYQVVKEQAPELINELFALQNLFLDLTYEGRKSLYLEIRHKFNLRNSDSLKQASFFIFLNRTCFNGLYRVNRKNEFNVPMGDYKNPKICDEQNLLAVSSLLSRVEIHCGDYSLLADYIEEKAFVYIDPPYKPLNKTSSFNNYTDLDFTDQEQIRLKRFCDRLVQMNVFWLQSNSHFINSEGKSYFKELYHPYTVNIIQAKRLINTFKSKTDKVNEVLIHP